ncbi:hypothetical protein XFLAVUS301_36270 [Xanthobacter flavus]|uniref:Uncharacterized protein n=1 Tax=Xanthobacter flavus TaxID=281 RepID=A0A9W6CK90_XANFL|nr:hypothetical protein XFLAVUS301_36270 [Xanthobacter flavus]
MLAGLALGRLFIGPALLHLAENALALHALLENLEGLLNIVVSDENLQKISNLKVVPVPRPDVWPLARMPAEAGMGSV